MSRTGVSGFQLSLFLFVILAGIFVISIIGEITFDTANGLSLGISLPAQAADFLSGIASNVIQIVIFSVVAEAAGGKYVHRLQTRRPKQQNQLSSSSSQSRTMRYPGGRRY